jgi:N-methylhydantoinase A
MNIEAVAVSLLWSIVNPNHEVRLGELIAEIMPDIPYTLSHQLNPIIREYPRTSSTAIDASLKPLMQSHLSEFERDLRAANYNGEILVSSCSGGAMHVKDVVEKPIYTVKSGPAMAPLAGIAYAEAEGEGNDVIIVDTGGTTFDVSLVRAGQIKFTRETWLLGEWIGYNLGLSSVDVRSVGAGGGSIAWIDSGGLLRVGPKSAGAVPGPACYGTGGTEATVTDAAVVLGYIDPDYFLGGRMALDAAAARHAVTAIAEASDMSAEQAAFAIITIAGEQMIKAIQEITVQDGVNPAESILVAGGGAAGLNILPIAKALGCAKVLVPSTAGALSACGGQYSNIVTEYAPADTPIRAISILPASAPPWRVSKARSRPSATNCAGAASKNSTANFLSRRAISISSGKWNLPCRWIKLKPPPMSRLWSRLSTMCISAATPSRKKAARSNASIGRAA